ncbi:SusD/RagB family nutrient-binding outer membrane lipoprotein [Pararcticibacter amylolyticus]|uniref:SusD/RagB family nutrient-binding outer membrane lipoprotein n=1 Tax=Pararcticibacter amylolyticus TaxID=2173175 RepID=A0A2U2PHF5_9SPHI|nr:SusD/RagB family nutrient-binding outer membrane lipoprotein [Pararcticibacter amylolyticus]PWG80848.1 SusD/RagB family nutrient-binding outer membrane lipoprotein [Pararcticibacter amylolyticus]
MKRLISNPVAILLVLLALITSCKKDFIDLNTNPNAVTHALPRTLLAPTLTDIVSGNMNRSQRITNELMQVTVNMGDTEGKIFRYDIRKSEGDYLYNLWYAQLTNLNDMYTGAEETNSPEFKGIALICKAWVFSLLTDTYGDVPYFDANKARDGLFTPAFDRQKDIYTDIFLKLEEANTLLMNAGDVLSSSDPVFGGKTALWRKFGNSLYLRLLLRVSGKAEMNVPAKIKEIVEAKASNYPLMQNNSESAILKWTGAAPYVSPFATWRDADWYTPKLASFFVDNLNEWSDPRIQKWGTLYQGEYAGVPGGYPPGQAPVAKSSLSTSLMTEPLLGNIMNYAELQFILAEAAAKGWIGQSAKNYYEAGVESAIKQWQLDVPSGYLTNERARWDDNYSLDQKMELIHLQKYYALFFTDLQSWFECRRTGHPFLPKGTGLLNNGVLPARLNYPVYVQSVNPENYKAAVASQGPDDVTTNVWWQRP